MEKIAGHAAAPFRMRGLAGSTSLANPNDSTKSSTACQMAGASMNRSSLCFFAAIKTTPRVLDDRAVFPRPKPERANRLEQRAAELRQFVIHPWRHRREHGAGHQA